MAKYNAKFVSPQNTANSPACDNTQLVQLWERSQRDQICTSWKRKNNPKIESIYEKEKRDCFEIHVQDRGCKDRFS